MLKRISAALTGILTIACLLGATPKVATAQTSETSSSRSFAVVPPSFELFANPGESVSNKLRVRNDSDAKTTYQVVVDDFKAVGEEGSVDIIDSQSNDTYSLSKWVFPEPKNFSLEAKQEREIPFTINVPKDAEPGGHYASILVNIGSDTTIQGSGAAVSSRVGSLLLLRVSGNIREDASIETFKPDKRYYQGSPVNFEARVKNNGNNHIKPTGTIIVTNMFGQKVTEIPFDGLNVLPAAIRKMDTEWKFSNFLANRYTATLVATYGQQNKPLSASTSFIIMPKPFLYGMIILLVLIVFTFGSKKRIKRLLHNLTR